MRRLSCVGAFVAATIAGPWAAAADPALSADFNGDYCVDQLDLFALRQGYGGPAPDADGNGVADGMDFLMWQRQLGSGEPQSTLVVPEPSAMLIWGSLAAALGLVLSGASPGARHRRSE